MDLDLPEFVKEWSRIMTGAHQCESCLDSDFSLLLAKKFGDIGSKPVSEQQAAHQEVQALLSDICEWAALTSDKVELKNGQVQWAASKRGSQNVKNARSAAETTFLQSAIKQNSWSQQAVGKETLPSKLSSSSILKMSGVSSTNQMTKDFGKQFMGELSFSSCSVFSY